MSSLPNQALPLGSRLGVYEIKAVLNVEAFGISYRAWNHHLKERVDIQEYFPADCAMRSPEGTEAVPKSPADKAKFDSGLKLFFDQAEALLHLDHPNIVKAENVLSFHGTAYLILAHQEGKTLSQLVQAPSALAEAELKFILTALLDALQTAHEAKVVHGGIQPATILLSNNGEPSLIDFTGATLAMAAQTARFTGQLAPGYAAPELYAQANKPSPGSDYYALGATIYYCITHHSPADAQSRKLALSKSEPDPLASLAGAYGSTFSAEFLQAVDWMLRLEENDRPHSAAEVLALLKTEPAHSQGDQSAIQHDIDPSSHPRAFAKRSVGFWAAAGIIGLAVIVFWLQQNPSGTVSNSPDKAMPPPSVQEKSIPSTAAQIIKPEETNAPAADQVIQKAEPAHTAAANKTETAEPDNQLKRPNQEDSLTSAADNRQPLKMAGAEDVAIPLNQSKAKSELNDKPAHRQNFTANQNQVLADKPVHPPRKQTVASISGNSIHGYLAHAKRAMQQRRLTTPPGDNAYHYYQLALSKDSDNPEALAGLRKIVAKYVWVIREAKADGDLAKAKRVLQKAESVSPHHPKLQQLRAELNH